jgi:hypothetical protein
VRPLVGPGLRTVAPLAGLVALAGCGGGSVGNVRVGPARETFPSPPAGAVVYARQHGADALAVALVPGRTRTLVQVSLVGPDGRGVSGEHVQVGARTATACGPGCYRTAVAARPRALVVRIGGASERFALAEAWPPPRADRLLARAERAWRSLRTLVDRQHLASGPTTAIDTLWLSVAPDRVSYRIRGGASAVIIGARRWDRLGGGRWRESRTAPQRAPAPPWLEPTDVRLVGGTPTSWRVTFYDPRLQAWFELWIDRRTLRTRELRMTATAHFMRDRYGPFDAPLEIEPPVGS